MQSSDAQCGYDFTATLASRPTPKTSATKWPNLRLPGCTTISRMAGRQRNRWDHHHVAGGTGGHQLRELGPRDGGAADLLTEERLDCGYKGALNRKMVRCWGDSRQADSRVRWFNTVQAGEPMPVTEVGNSASGFSAERIASGLFGLAAEIDPVR